MDKIGKTGEFLGRILWPLLKTRLPLMKNVIMPLAKSVLISLALTAASSATDAAIHKKMFGSGTISLIILNEEVSDIMTTINSFEESKLGACLLIIV